MSSNSDSSTPERRFSQRHERIVTDSVHGRMRPPQVFCESCKQIIVGNSSEIEKHFAPTHKSNSTCVYCNSKVFNYIETKYSPDGTPINTVRIFHTCPKPI